MSAIEGRPRKLQSQAIEKSYQTHSAFLMFFALASFPFPATAASEPIQFAPPVKYTNFSSPIFHICAGDFNGDQLQDLAVGGGATQIFTNDGTGTLHFFTSVSGSGPLTAADLNGGNRLDLVITGPSAVWLNSGNSFTRTNIVGAMSFPLAAAVGDLNGDGKRDLALQGDHFLQIFLGQSNGAFTFATSYSIGNSAIAIADFDRDSRMDIVVANDPFSGAVLFGNGNGTFTSPTNFGAPSSDSHAIAIGDFDRNGTPDLAVVNSYYPPSVGVFLNNGDRTFGPEKRFEVPYSPTAIAVADFTGDGNLDIVTGGPLTILPGIGDGTFGTAVTNFSSVPYVQYIAVADFDGDGRPDIATASGGQYSFNVLLNRTLPPVSLTIQNASGLLVLNWPDRADYKLESTANLALVTGWSLDTNISFVVGGQRIVVTTPQGERYFRLKK
jgi:hypothetical protein